MATEPTKGSIDAVTEMVIETPENENPSEETEAPVEASQDVEPEIEVEVAESEDDTDYSSEEETIDEDEIESSEAVPLELSDDIEIEYKADGVMKKATLGELKRGAAGQDYIQKGMEQNAQARKELEQMAISIKQEREQLLQRMEQLTNDAPQKPIKPSKELQNSDPLRYLEEMEQYREQQDNFERLQEEAEQMRQQQLAQEQQAQELYEAEQAEALRKEIPELNDPEKSKKLLTEITETVTSHYGMPPELVGQLSHGWEFKIMRDAVAYRKLMANKDKVVEKSKGARPMVKPGAKRTENVQVKKAQQARSRMKQKGDINSVADYLLS
jgi:hypothetical protein|tara:strand:+ start:431 stop:1414 length:984 start_codon:yes stop_codon:yes gene_type:complete